MTSVSLVEGWTGPLDFALKANGAAQDLTGATVVLILSKRDGVAVDTAADVSIIDAAAGTVRYAPDATDLTYADNPYRARFKVTDGAGKITFFPSGEADKWTVYRP